DKVVAEAKAVLPSNVSLDLGGDSANQGEVFSSFGSTLALSALDKEDNGVIIIFPIPNPQFPIPNPQFPIP
ncbi:hypothetical protein, partial [Nostoc sp. 'Peltigera membranacea cyanobiont' 232]|uniref:hypothetical protein n=1 Tax=Nostoc sp. 'Peltigera membranacea cyanobiont' 232 TaxID=2014531 RepID=UPI000B9F8035